MTPHVQDGERAADRQTIERRGSGASRISGSVRWRSLGLAVGLSLSCVLMAATSNADKPPTTATVLRRAELIRNPYAGIAVDIDLSVVSRESGRELRSSSYILITNRRDQSLLLMQQLDQAAPGALLIDDDIYSLLLPRASKPIELALRHVVAGDLSHIGFLRINLRIRYEPHSDGEETLGNTPCWRLELEPKSEPALFGRVRYWVAQDGLLPIRIEYYTQAGALLKTVRFTSYRETTQGLRPDRIEIDDVRRTAETAKLTLSTPQVVRTKKLWFRVADLFVLRDAARRLATESDNPVRGEQLVDALLASPRGAGLVR